MTRAFDAADFELTLPVAPYPGLRPFEKDEWAIFFGRETMIDKIVERLIDQQVVVVHGDSGCGKSSIIRAGVLARLEQEHARSGLTWRTTLTTPREAPLDRLAATLAALDGRPHDAERIFEIRRILNFGADAPAALVRLLRRGDSDHLCILIDQFEELFAFARRTCSRRDEARLMVQLLVGLLTNPPPGLYVILTMRSEFLGACAQYPGFAEAVNTAQYLLPRMEHRDLVRAVRDPAALYGGHVSLELAEWMIADAGGTQDELPLIQHGLLMLYRQKLRQGSNDRGRWRLDLSDLSSNCRLCTLLSNHADEVLRVAEPAPHAVVESLFRALTEINAEGQAVRRPQTFAALLAATGASNETLRHVVDTFRSEGASFLTPYGDAPIDPATLVDISHEALIRAWPRIADARNGWLASEFQDGLIWRSLLVQAESFACNPSSLLSFATASERVRWMEGRTAPWAERYGDNWDGVQKLVQASVDAGVKAREVEHRRARRQFMLLSTIAGLLFALLLVVVIQNRRTHAALTQASNASAETLWNKLDFADAGRLTNEELNALWEIMAGRPEVRDAFISQLTTESKRSGLLGRRPPPVIRAIALQWPSGQAASVFGRTVAGIPGSTNQDELMRLGAAAQAIGSKVPPESAVEALTSVVDGIAATADPQQIAAFAAAMQPLAQHLTEAQAGTVLGAILTAFSASSSMSAGVVVRLKDAAMAIAPKLTSDQALARLRDVLKAAPTTRYAHSDGLRAIAVELTKRLDAQQAAAELREILARPGTQPSGELIVAGAAAALAGQVTPDDARAVLGPLVPRIASESGPLAIRETIRTLAGRHTPEAAQQLLHTTIDALRTTKTSSQAGGLGFVAAEAAARLTPDQMSREFAALLRTFKGTTELPHLAAIALPLKVTAAGATPAEIEAALPVVVGAIASTDDRATISRLRDAATALTVRFSAGQADAGLSLVLKALSRAEDSGQRRAMATIAQTLASLLDSSQARTAVPAILGSIAEPGLTQTIEVVAAHMTPDQAGTGLRWVLSAIRSTTDPDQLTKLAATARTVAARSSADRAAALFREIVSTTLRASDRDQLLALTSMSGALAIKLTPDQAHATLTRLVGAIGSTSEPDVLHALGEPARAMAASLAPGAAQSVFAHVLKAVTSTLVSQQLTELKSLLVVAAGRLTPAQAQSEAAVIQKAISGIEDSNQRGALASAIPALAGALSSEQTRSLLADVVAAIPKTSEAPALLDLGLAAKALGSGLTETQVAQTLKDIPGASASTPGGPERIAAMGLVIQPVAGRLNKYQAKLAAETLLIAIGASTSAVTLNALGATVIALAPTMSDEEAHARVQQAVKLMATTSQARLEVLKAATDSLAARLTPEQAKSALPSVLAPLAVARDRNQTRALGSAALALAARLPADAPEERSAVLAALKAIAAVTTPRTRDDFCALVRKLTAGWDGERIETTLLSLLGWSATDEEAAIWAELLVGRFPHESPAHAIETLVDALKYPAAAGSATDLLLGGLKKIDSSAPGTEGGLDGTLSWIRKNYPEIDLRVPPACPTAPVSGLTCPSIER